MATVTGFTAERMEAIENASVIDGSVVGDNLILEKFDGTTINAGNVRGPTGSPGVSAGDLAIAFPVGMIVDYIDVNPPTGWLKMTGLTITGGETLYPALWAVIPDSMKSGANIIMPDTRGRVSVGHNSTDSVFNEILEIGGAKTHTLTSAEMPTHTHVQTAHNHIQDAHNHTQDSHNHTQVSHYHEAGTLTAISTTDDTHSHTLSAGTGSFAWATPGTTTGGFQGVVGSTYDLGLTSHTGEPTDTLSRPFHTHDVQGNTEQVVSTNVAVTATNQATTATNQATTAVNQTTGGSAAHNNLQPYIVFLKIIKAV